MKNKFTITIVLCLIVTVVYARVWGPGYDENGKDINECNTSENCPKGMSCVNTTGNFYCMMANGEIAGIIGGGFFDSYRNVEYVYYENDIKTIEMSKSYNIPKNKMKGMRLVINLCERTIIPFSKCYPQLVKQELITID